MLVMLKRPFSCHLGRFKPSPDGVEMPDSLYDLLPSTAEVLVEPDEAAPVPDPDEPRDSFTKFMKTKKPAMNSKAKQKPIPLSKVGKET
jgi:hypothetical protein